MSEHDQQVIVVRWWDKQHPSQILALTAYPSGAIMGGKNKFAGIAKLKKEGWRKGVSDLSLDIARGGFFGLKIEMKDIGKTKCSLSSEQIAYLDESARNGYMAVWCAGADDAIKTIKDYMNLAETAAK